MWPIKDSESEEHPRAEEIAEDARPLRRTDIREREEIEDLSIEKEKTAPPQMVHDPEKTMDTTTDAPQFENPLRRPSLIRR